MLYRKIASLVAIALTAVSCADPGQMLGQPASNRIGNALSPPTFYQGGSYDKFQNNVAVQGGDKATRITVRATITANSANSWMRDAPWNEIVLTVQNLSHREIQVVSIHGVTAQGVMVDQGGMDAFTTIEQQRATIMQNQLAQQNQSPATPASPDLGGMLASAMTNALGVAPYTGVAPAAGGTAGAAEPQKANEDAQNASLSQQAADFQNVSTEYIKRSLEQANLPSKAAITGSAFFPVSAGEITEIVVSVRESLRSENVKDITLALPKEATSAETTTSAGRVPQ